MPKHGVRDLEGLQIEEVDAAQMGEVVRVISRGMRDNPNVVAAFGDAPEARHTRLLRLFGAIAASEVPGYHWHTLAARGPYGSILGVCGMMPPGMCQPGVGQTLRVVPALLALGPRGAWRTTRWLGFWSKRDPGHRHWHLGPVAVDVHVQGRGIGSALMRAFCARMDAAGEEAYLETDKEINVRLYEKFGFEVVGEEEVLGVPNWFMTRRARKD